MGGTSLTTKEWLRRARAKHGNKYDYSQVEYKNGRTKVCIICPNHGEFWQRAKNHIDYGQNCPKCKGNYQHSTKEWIDIAKKVHGDKYDYSKTEYKNVLTNVCIICPEHGKFWQLPGVHIIQKSGCTKCCNRYQRTTEEWIEEARKIHGNRYDYSKVNYTCSKKKVCIICPKHGKFLQKAESHISQQSGCPRCFSGISKIQMDWLNYLCVTIPELEYAGSGKEFRIPKTRYNVDGYDPKTKTIYEMHGDWWHGNPKFHHPNNKHPKNGRKFGKLFKKTLHREIKLRKLGYKYFCIWEHEWRRGITAIIKLQQNWKKRYNN